MRTANVSDGGATAGVSRACSGQDDGIYTANANANNIAQISNEINDYCWLPPMLKGSQVRSTGSPRTVEYAGTKKMRTDSAGS
jgi:hypothetical protein